MYMTEMDALEVISFQVNALRDNCRVHNYIRGVCADN